MPWKKDEHGAFAIDDAGNPVWTDEAGQDKGVDYASLSKRISETTKESVQRKEKLRELEKALEPFRDIENPLEWVSEAQKALDMMRNAPDKEKALEDQVRARVEAATKPLHEKLATTAKDAEILRAQLERESITNAFARSSFVNEKFVNPALASDLFGGRFSLRDGQIVAIGDDGQPVYGAEGIAGFDEALAKMVESSPYKANLLKGSMGSGSGATTNGGSGQSGRFGRYSDCKTEADKVAFLKQNQG